MFITRLLAVLYFAQVPGLNTLPQLEVLAACLQLFALDNVGVDTSGLKAR